MRKKLQVCATVCALIFCLTACSSTASVSQSSSTAALPNEKTYFESDSAINQFMVEYNEIAKYKITSAAIEKGNTKNKAIVQTRKLYIVIEDTSNKLSIDIEDKDEEEKELYPIFQDMLLTLDSALSEEQILQAWEDIQNTKYEIYYSSSKGVLPNYQLNNIQLSYSSNDVYGQKTTVKIYG